MYELINVHGDSFYIQCPAKIGVVKTGEAEVVLIDSGSDKDAGKKALRIFEANGWSLSAIYNTHSHADHIGGNRFLQSRTGCRVFVPGIEKDFTVHPLLEPALLYGGFPPADLRHKFLMAQESEAELLSDDALPAGFSIVPLPGHSPEMVGFRTPDDVVYLADAVASRSTLDKYGISYTWDVGAYLATLECLKTMHARMFIPTHADAADDIVPLAEYNIQKVHETAERIMDICRVPATFETILSSLFTAYGLVMDFQQYALIGSTVRSYLSWLLGEGQLTADFHENKMLWRHS